MLESFVKAGLGGEKKKIFLCMTTVSLLPCTVSFLCLQLFTQQQDRKETILLPYNLAWSSGEIYGLNC